MAGEKELTLDIYGGLSPRPSPQDDPATATAVSSTTTSANGHGNGPERTRINSSAVVTANRNKKNGFLPSGMSLGSDRSDKNSKKQQLSKKTTPIWRRFMTKPSQAVASNHQVAHINSETTAKGAKRSYDVQFPTATSGTLPIADDQNIATLSGQSPMQVDESTANVRRSSSTVTRSDSGHEQRHLNVILGAPAGFRDSSFEESDEAAKTTADGNLHLPTADGSLSSVSEGISSSFTEVKKRTAPPVPLVQPSLPPPELIVKDIQPNKRPAPEVPSSKLPEKSTETTHSQPLQSSTSKRQSNVDNKPAVPPRRKIVIPKVFQHSEEQPKANNLQSPSRPKVGSISSIFDRRPSFLRRLENIVGRTPTSSAVSTITRGAKRSSDDSNMHNSSVPGELDESTGSLVSQLFQSALSNHDDSSGGKKFKFPVAGIDVPAEPDEQQAEDADDEGAVQSPRVRKGFSYLKDVKVAAEVTRRAANMTARRQYESMEELVRDRTDVHAASDADRATLRAARARLHAPQPRFDLPAVPQSSGRSQMLQDVVDAARRRARKNGMYSADNDYLQEAEINTLKNRPYSASQPSVVFDNDETAARNELTASEFHRRPPAANFRSVSADRLFEVIPNYGMYTAYSDYIQEGEINRQHYSDDRTQNLLHGGYDVRGKQQQRSMHELYSPSNFESGTLRDAKESTDETILINRPGGASQTFAVFDNDGTAAGHELRAPDFHDFQRRPPAANFRSASADSLLVDGVTSHSAARHAHRRDIDPQLNADRLAADDVARAASARNMSAASVAGWRADAGFDARHGRDFQLRPHHRPARSTISNSDEEPPDSWLVSDGEEDDVGGYTVSIVGGQVHARRQHRPRPAARNHRRRSSLRRRPHVQQRPISVEVWSSGDEGESGWNSGHPRRRHFIADRRRSPLTVNTNNAKERPHSVVGHIRNLGITQTTENIYRPMTGTESTNDILHYFSDPETQIGPYRSGTYVSQSNANFNSSPSRNFIVPEVDAIRSGSQASSAMPLHARSVPVSQHRVETVDAIDPRLADIGTINRRYFVQMRLNATRGWREVTGADNGGGRSNSGVSSDGGVITGGWYGSAPQLRQLTDDQYAGARYNALGSTWFTAMQPDVRHTSVYDVRAPADQRASNFTRRPPPSSPPWIAGGSSTSGHVLRSVTPSSRSPTPAVGLVMADRRRPVGVLNSNTSRSTVEFDIELEPVADRNRRVEMEDRHGSRLLASVHSNGLTSQRPMSPPRYGVQLNETMRFDIDSPNDRRTYQQSAANPSNYDPVHQQRQQRRHRPTEQAEDLVTERRRTVVDTRSPPQVSRRRREIPVVYDDDSDVGKTNRINAETRRTVRTDSQSPVHVANNDLPRVVRGSILIQNSIDTSGTPRHVDVVTAGSDATSDAPLVVEDNANMFDGRYRQSRENPIYLSDTELSPDEADGSAMNSRVHTSTRSQQNRRQEGHAQNKTSIVDDFDKNVKISRGT